MNTFLRDLALAHQWHEGYYRGSRSWRNNNPGNLRNGPPSDKGGFTIFKTFAAGFAALEADLRIKICGQSRHIDYSKNPKFIDYVRIYAPADDGNSPSSYVQALCRMLSKYNLKPDTPLSQMARLINGEIDSIPDHAMPQVNREARIKGLERRIRLTKDPSIKESIFRLLERLLTRIDRS